MGFYPKDKALFVSTTITGTGAEQLIPHTLGCVPSKLFFSAQSTEDYPAPFTITEGVHTTTNLKFTATVGLKYQVQAWR